MRRLLAGTIETVGGAPVQPVPDDAGFVDRLSEPDRLPDWLESAAELDHYVSEFTRTGFTGGINWYRNLDRNWQTTFRNSPGPK